MLTDSFQTALVFTIAQQKTVKDAERNGHTMRVVHLSGLLCMQQLEDVLWVHHCPASGKDLNLLSQMTTVHSNVITKDQLQ